MPIATKSSKLDISHEKKTSFVAKKISKFLKKGDIIFCNGEIGVGKTTFVKYVINEFQKKFNLTPTEVPSPTFSILLEYPLKNFSIKHYDLYRINEFNELYEVGIFENVTENLVFVEWPEKLKGKIKCTLELNFEYNNNFNKRFLNILSKNTTFNINGF